MLVCDLKLEKIEKDKPVLIAGDLESLHMAKSDKNKGISYHVNQLTYAVSFC